MIVVSLDWLSLYGQITKSPDNVCDEMPDKYRILNEGGRTAWFLQSRLIGRIHDGRPVTLGYLLYMPSSPIMSPSTCTFKVDNALLYTPYYYRWLIEFLQDFQIVDTSITRADIALDFKNVRGYSGAALAQSFTDGKLIRKGSRKLSVVMKSRATIQTNGDVNLKPTNAIESVTFGKSGGACQVQLYNKSEELRTHVIDGVCTKQYIRDTWRAAGIDTEEKKADVWRLEFRLSSKARTLLQSDGIERPCYLCDFAPDNLESIAKACVAKWFQIYDITYSKLQTHLNRLRQLDLFGQDGCRHYMVTKHADHREASRYTKGIINTLSNSEKWREYYADPSDAKIMTTAGEILKCIYAAERREARRRERDTLFSEILSYYRTLPHLTESENLLCGYIERCDGYYKTNTNIHSIN